MNIDDTAARKARLAGKMESFLNENSMLFSRQALRKQRRDIFDIVFDSPEEGLLEQRVVAYIHDRLILFEASVPLTSSDADAVAALINTLNNAYPAGLFQYDIRDGELNWTHYLVARNGTWPGDDSVLNALDLARKMAAVLYHALLSDGALNQAIDNKDVIS